MIKHIACGVLFAQLAGAAFAATLNNQLMLMSESSQKTFTGMLVRQSGAQCPTVTRVFYQGKLETKEAVWNVGCNSRDNFVLVFKDDEANTTQVMKCAEVKSLGAPECFTKIKSQ